MKFKPGEFVRDTQCHNRDLEYGLVLQPPPLISGRVYACWEDAEGHWDVSGFQAEKYVVSIPPTTLRRVKLRYVKAALAGKVNHDPI